MQFPGERQDGHPPRKCGSWPMHRGLVSNSWLCFILLEQELAQPTPTLCASWMCSKPPSILARCRMIRKPIPVPSLELSSKPGPRSSISSNPQTLEAVGLITTWSRNLSESSPTCWERKGLYRLIFGIQAMDPNTRSSRLGCMAAVRATLSPSQLSPALSHKTSTSCTAVRGKSEMRRFPCVEVPRLSFRQEGF